MKTVVKIPKERMSSVLGKNRETLKKIERLARVNLKKDENSIVIEGESLSVWKTKKILKAIARGFNAETALKLLNEENILKVIHLKEHVSGRKKIKRTKGRIIGNDGKTRRIMESLTGADICIHGKTVSLIANQMMIPILERAIGMLIEGSKHGNVYKYIEKEIKSLNKGGR
ncbi:MAG: KH domain-containing protein [Candidatus Aenigmatarchaeota archaeon]